MRRLVNRKGLKDIYQSAKVRIDYRSLTLGGNHSDDKAGRRLFKVIVAIVILPFLLAFVLKIVF